MMTVSDGSHSILFGGNESAHSALIYVNSDNQHKRLRSSRESGGWGGSLDTRHSLDRDEASPCVINSEVTGLLI